MKLTAKARYAVMAVTDIAVNGKSGMAVSLSDISIRQDISLSFLEQLFGKLRKASIVDSQRGASGGYFLARPSTDIYIGEIMRAIDEEVQTKRCDDSGISCTGKGAKCLAHDLWQAMEDHIEGFFSAISIQDVLERHFPELCPDIANMNRRDTTRLYLDHNASSPARPEVMSAMMGALKTHGNASAPHGAGRSAHKLVSEAREAVALAMGVCAQDLIFTASGTESINTAILSAVKGGSKRLFISSMDHPASILMAEQSGAQSGAQSGVVVEMIPVLSTGLLDLNWLMAKLAVHDMAKDGRPFISVAVANSETGVIQDIARIVDMVGDVGGLLLLDAVQALGKTPVSAIGLADYVAVSAHKIGGPQGVGALYVSPDAPYSPMMIGGGQEKRKRAGTLNVAGIAGFGAAAVLAENLAHTHEIRDMIETGLTKMEPSLIVFGKDAPRLPNTLFFAIPDTASSTLMMALDLEDISVSTGLACSSGKVGASRAVTAMGLADKAQNGAIRISLGYTSTLEDAHRFLTAWAKTRRVKYQGAA